jgi:conflict system pore-forming effector with SLATT domain/uncharacterized protein DUF4231
MPSAKFGSTLENVWADYRRCAARSRSLKTALDKIRMWALVLVTLSGALGLLSSQVPEAWNPGRFLAFLSALSAAIGAYITAQALSLGLEREWVLSRSIAEALKSEAFRYLARAQPYAGARQTENDETLSQKAGEYRDRITLGSFLRLADTERTKGMPEDWLTMDGYLQQRVHDQIGYFEQKAEESSERGQRLRTATIVLGAVAVVLGAAHGVYTELAGFAAWIPVVTSVSGAITTHLFSGRFQFLAESYETMVSRLNRLLETWERVPAPDKAARAGEFVGRFEEILLVENKQWVAEFDKSADRAAVPQPAQYASVAAAPDGAKQ